MRFIIGLVVVFACCCCCSGAPNSRNLTTGAIRSMMYSPLRGYPCVRLLDANRTIGCTQGSTVVSGVLKLVEPLPATAFVAERPTVAVLEERDMNRANLTALLGRPGVVGVLVLTGGPVVGAYSPDSPRPNGATFAWNSAGDGLSFESFSAPVWLVHENDSASVRAEATANGAGGFPLRGASMRTRMDAGRDAVTCLRRGRCLPVGGQSVVSSLSVPVPGRKIVLATATLDSSSFFHDVAPGADAYLSGAVALAAAQLAIARFTGPDPRFAKADLVFAYFTGEAWGGLGSNRFAQDLAAPFNCTRVNAKDPMACDEPFMSNTMFNRGQRLSDVSAVVDVGQVGLIDAASPAVFVHAPAAAAAGEAELLRVLEDTSQIWSPDVTVTFAFPNPDPAKGLPPSPALAFRSRNSSLPVVVLADHSAEFVNPAYHSHLDTAVASNLTALCETATLVARVLYALATGTQSTNASIKADCAFVSSLAGCLTRNFKCSLVEHYLGSLNPADGSKVVKVSGYTGVFGTSESSVSIHPFSYFLRLLLLDRTAIERNVTSNCTKQSECKVGFHCIGVFPNGTCIRGATTFHDAISTGISWNKKSQAWIVVDPKQPTWTES